MTAFDIKNFPLLKLAFPLVAGIVIGWLCDVEPLHIATLSVVSALLLAAGLFSSAPRWLFGVGATGVMLVAGLFGITCDKGVARPKWPDEKAVFEAQLLEVPHLGGVSTTARARVKRLGATLADGWREEGDVNLYFATSVEAEALRVGEVLRFEGRVKNPVNAGNPAEFDAVRYMRLKGVTGTVFLPVDAWESLGAGELSWGMRALALRDRVVRFYERLGFKGNALALLSAVSVGERRGFSADLREVYADAGVSHLLALSGLHLGIFYMVLSLLLAFVRGSRALFVVRELLIVLLLWCFATVAGLSPSVVRAAVLFSLVGVGRCLRRDGAALNSLSFAAVVMLVLSPRLLFDVGFQLSFASVAAILLLVPWLREVAGSERSNRAWNWFFTSVAVSLAAQVGVTPFVWYYFGTFPLYFLFANLLLVPLATLLVMLVVLLWTVSFLPFAQAPVAWLLQWLLSFMNGVVEFVAALPGASCVLPPAGVAGAVCMALLLWCFFGALVQRRYRVAVFAAVVSVAVALLNFFLPSGEARNDSMLVFNNKKSAAVLAVTAGGEGYCFSSVPQFDADIDRVVEPFVKRERLRQPLWLENGYSDSVVAYSEGLLSFGGLRVQLLADDCWLEDSVQRPVDALLLCRGFLGGVKDLLVHYPTNCVLLDGSLYEGSRRRLLRECKAAGVGYVDIARVGAVKLVGAGDAFAVEYMREK